MVKFIELFQSSNRTVLKNLGNFTYSSFETQKNLFSDRILFQIDIMLLCLCIKITIAYHMTLRRVNSL